MDQQWYLTQVNDPFWQIKTVLATTWVSRQISSFSAKYRVTFKDVLVLLLGSYVAKWGGCKKKTKQKTTTSSLLASQVACSSDLWFSLNWHRVCQLPLKANVHTQASEYPLEKTGAGPRVLEDFCVLGAVRNWPKKQVESANCKGYVEI